MIYAILIVAVISLLLNVAALLFIVRISVFLIELAESLQDSWVPPTTKPVPDKGLVDIETVGNYDPRYIS